MKRKKGTGRGKKKEKGKGKRKKLLEDFSKDNEGVGDGHMEDGDY